MTIARISLAVDRKFKQEGQPTADFINCIAFGKTAEVIEKYVTKGTKIAVVGRIQTGSYTNKDGATVYTTDVVADRVEFLEWGDRNERQSAPRQSGNMGGFDAAPEGFSAIDEDIPF